MRVSDRLTEIAEIIVEHAVELGWRQIAAQFGVPMCGEGMSRRPVSICVVGYGKLGGIELGYSSDLDLVFLHDSHGELQETAGARPIDNQLFFVRLAQRIMHLLTMHSAAGRLYEVDVRLRPSGKGGLLVTSIGASPSTSVAKPGPGNTKHSCTLAPSREPRGCARTSRAFVSKYWLIM
jgi:glutamate-ammonia-ligase adenylyltransferase